MANSTYILPENPMDGELGGYSLYSRVGLRTEQAIHFIIEKKVMDTTSSYSTV